MPVMLKAHHWTVSESLFVATSSEVQEIHQCDAHPLEHLGSGCARRDEFGDVVDHSNVVRFLEGAGPMVAVARGELGHDDPDHEEAHRSLDVGTMRDGKPLV